MQLSPCTSCRRHVRPGGPCPFCGGAPEVGLPIEVEGRHSRGHAALLAAFGVAVAIDASACGVYGGPPPNYASENEGSSFAIDTRPDDLTARATALGCTAEQHTDTVAVRCATGTLLVEKTRVSCPELAEGACRALWARVTK